MLAAFDYTGAATLVAACTGLVAAVGVIVNGRKANTIKTDTAHISSAVTTSNGNTLADLAEKLPIDQPADGSIVNPPSVTS